MEFTKRHAGSLSNWFISMSNWTHSWGFSCNAHMKNAFLLMSLLLTQALFCPRCIMSHLTWIQLYTQWRTGEAPHRTTATQWKFGKEKRSLAFSSRFDRGAMRRRVYTRHYCIKMKLYCLLMTSLSMTSTFFSGININRAVNSRITLIKIKSLLYWTGGLATLA